MPLGTEVGLVPGRIVLDGDPAPPAERGTAATPTFRPMFIVVKRLDGPGIPLGTDVGLGSDNIVLDEDPATPTERGTYSSPQIRFPVYVRRQGSLRP